MDQRLRYKGYPVRVSDKIPDTRKAWCAYQERRILEDTLKTLKTRSSCVRNCVSDNESLIGKTFVLFLVASIEMIVRARLRKYFEGGKTSDSLPTDYDRSCRVLDSLNNVIQTKFCDGYYSEEVQRKNADFLKLLVSRFPALNQKRNGIAKTKRKQNPREEAVCSEIGLRQMH